jgi:hypothetical protein
MKIKSPARRVSANQAQKLLDVASIGSELTAPNPAEQHLISKFRLTPVWAALVAELAGIGCGGARA